MRTLLILLASLCLGLSQSQYIAESPLPKGWPAPTNYYKAEKKIFPKHRAASTSGSITGLTFMRLFKHIKKQHIPMTAPVVSNISGSNTSNKRADMIFLYRDTFVSDKTDNKKVAVKDYTQEQVLSYTWQGCDCKNNILLAKQALNAHAKKAGLTLKKFRLLGYNSPSMPKEKQTWELVAGFSS